MSGTDSQSLLRPPASNIIFDSEKDRGLDRADTDSISSVEDEKHDPDEYVKLQTTEQELSTSTDQQPKVTKEHLACQRICLGFGCIFLCAFILVASCLIGHDISLDKLVNITELNLETGFKVEAGKQRLREYEFDVTHRWAAPSGVWKKMMLVNGQSPGPLIEVNTGDIVRVKVNNYLSGGESTTIHWHGIHQRNTTWMDGVAGISQCGIPPGKSFTYEFEIIDQRGTFWYHAHSKVQYTDGLYGPIIVHDPDEKLPSDTDIAAERIVFMGGSFHAYGEDLLESYLQPSSKWAPSMPGVEPLPDVILINGLAPFTNCSLTSSTWPSSKPPICDPSPRRYMTPMTNGTTRLRLINHSSFTSLYFTIDSHPHLTIIEIDGVEVAPITVPGVYLNIGQRYSILVSPTHHPAGSFAMRATIPKSCFLPYVPYTSSILESVNHQGTALLSYSPDHLNSSSSSSSSVLPITSQNPNLNIPQNCTDLPFSLPVPLRAIPAYPLDETHPPSKNTHEINFQFQQAGPVNRIFINRTSYSPLPNTTQLWLSLSQTFDDNNNNNNNNPDPDPGGYNNYGFPLNQQVLLLPEADKTVQVAINSRDVMEHPFHLHGHTFQIVAWGPGEFTAGSNPNTTWNLENPMRRDTLTIPGLSHVVIRFLADNPGIWALHCHVAWHMEAGMLITFLERPNDLKRLVHDMDPSIRELSRSFCSGEKPPKTKSQKT
ncbi:multicopper oxidase-domain-containing protein [Cercophora samala]|uniref:Multicopper oxidase-domain-containing protein n=1 Tax=Cercophora samala TaxID=330535 RepID=A0AA40DF24_9PEZI|nr:multicopper oxidase-domain-containing protein [Cercophora samala]